MAKAAKTDRKTPAKDAGVRRGSGSSRRWAVLLLVSVWMFVLGVLVGRGTSPVYFDIESLQKELSSLRQTVLEKEKTRFKISESGAAQKAEELDFYETLKKSVPESGAKPVAPTKPAPEPKAASESRPARENAGPSEPAKPPPRRVDPVPASEKPYTVQVASLKDAKTADAMVEKLRGGGFPAYRERADLGAKGIWHRVRIGSFVDAADASRILDRLKAGGLKPLLIRK